MLIRARFLRALKAVYAHQGELQPLLRRLNSPSLHLVLLIISSTASVHLLRADWFFISFNWNYC